MRKPVTFARKAKSKVKSNRERRKELDAKRVAKRIRAEKKQATAALAAATRNKVLVNPALLQSNYSVFRRPGFVDRGYYVDEPYTCRGCGAKGVWTATQQKWWYEVAKGNVWTMESRCLSCRRKLRAQKEEARKALLERTARNAARVRLPKSSRKSQQKSTP
jgi:hypothetical protein